MIFIETSVIDLLVVIVGADQNDCKFFINQGKRDFLDEFIRKTVVVIQFNFYAVAFFAPTNQMNQKVAHYYQSTFFEKWYLKY